MPSLKILSWNMNQKVSNWPIVLDSGVDVAMLQEAKTPPADLTDIFTVQQVLEVAECKLPWRSIVVGMVNSGKLDFKPIQKQPLDGRDPKALWVSRSGTLDVATVTVKETGEEIAITGKGAMTLCLTVWPYLAFASWGRRLQMAAGRLNPGRMSFRLTAKMFPLTIPTGRHRKLLPGSWITCLPLRVLPTG